MANRDLAAAGLSETSIKQINNEMVKALAESLSTGHDYDANTEVEGFKVHVKFHTDQHKNGTSTHRNGTGGTTIGGKL